MTAFGVWLGPRAADEYASLGCQYEARVRNAIRRFAARAGLEDQGLRSTPDLDDSRTVRRLPTREGIVYSVRAGMHVAVCELLIRERRVLVSAIVRRRELERRLGIPPQWHSMPALPIGTWGTAPSHEDRFLAAAERDAVNMGIAPPPTRRARP